MEQRLGCGVYEDAIPGAPDTSLSLRLRLERKFLIVRVSAHNRIYMVMVLRYDMASLDTRANWRAWAP